MIFYHSDLACCTKISKWRRHLRMRLRLWPLLEIKNTIGCKWAYLRHSRRSTEWSDWQNTEYKPLYRHFSLSSLVMTESAAIFPSMICNAFPSKTKHLETISPRTIVTGRGKLDAKKDLKVPWGTYCEVTANENITNDARSHTIPGISLHPCNTNGGSYFMNIDTGALIRGFDWTELPTT